MEVMQVKAASSGGSGRSRSDRGAPVRYPTRVDPQLASKLQERRRVVDACMKADGGPRSSPTSSLGNIDEGGGILAPVPAFPAHVLPERITSANDRVSPRRAGVTSNTNAARGIDQAQSAGSTTVPADQDADTTVDAHSHAKVQKHGMHKQRKPPTPRRHKQSR